MARRTFATIGTCCLLAVAGAVPAQAFHRRAPNRYEQSDDDNVATRLDRRLAAGELQLASDGPQGRLLALLRALAIPVRSQTVVFSKTSLQRHRISPANPRALFFGADAYVGWIPGASSLEIVVGDDRLGLAFYRLSQDPEVAPRLERDDSCLSCHATSRTHDEPGLLLRSVFADVDGEPIAEAGEATVTHRTPLAERWGGWYVTGSFRGDHRGNGFAERGDDDVWRVRPRPADDLTAFADTFDAARYPITSSDIGALLALEHQVTVHNLMVRATLQLRYLLERDRIVGELVDGGTAGSSTERIAERLARDLAAALLLDGEPDLRNHAAGADPGFARDYARLWPESADGTRLGELDLSRRTFRLPLSPMVHSPAFARLPQPLRARVLHRLSVAIGRGVPPGDVRLTRDERQTLAAHLAATLPDWPQPERR